MWDTVAGFLREEKGEAMKETIKRMIGDFVQNYEKRPDVTARWGAPLIGFADANHPDILNLKNIIAPTHKLPSEILQGAKIVIAYFVPFTKELAFTNRHDGEIASPEWALAYEETNAMFRDLNEYLIGDLKDKGYDASITPEAYTFDRDKLISNWSPASFRQSCGAWNLRNQQSTDHQKGLLRTVWHCGNKPRCRTGCPGGGRILYL